MRTASDQLVEAPLRAHLDARGQKKLGLGVRENHGADVAALEHDGAARSRRPLQLEQSCAHGRDRAHLARALTDFLRADRAGHVAPFEHQALAAVAGALEDDRLAAREVGRDLCHAIGVVPVDAALFGQQRHASVQRAGVDQQVAELVRHRSGDRGLAGAGRTVDRHHRAPPAHGLTSRSAPSARSVPTKRGKLVAMQSTSSIVVSPSATRPSTAAVIATR